MPPDYDPDRIKANIDRLELTKSTLYEEIRKIDDEILELRIILKQIDKQT